MKNDKLDKGWEKLFLKTLENLNDHIAHLDRNLHRLNQSIDKMADRVVILERQYSYWRGVTGTIALLIGFMSTATSISLNIFERLL